MLCHNDTYGECVYKIVNAVSACQSGNESGLDPNGNSCRLLLKCSELVGSFVIVQTLMGQSKRRLQKVSQPQLWQLHDCQ